jgi:N-acetylglucosaminyldiphosphoundecaprenol N-acetyl-beta-D-mannosaminyltransferase
MRKIPVIGLPVAVTNYADVVAWALEHALAGDRAYAVEAANVHVTALAKSDKAFHRAMARFDLICPDGMPLVWYLNSRLPAQEKLSDRVYGPTLMLETLRASNISDSPHRHFLLGGKQETLDLLKANFSRDFPNSHIAGWYSPPFGQWPDDEFERISAAITRSRANLIWVGLGCPKQENWIAAHKDRLPPGVYFGIGAAFAFHAGQVRQAPAAIQRAGMEWAYRLCMEPKRLFRRYFTYNSLFLYHVLRERISSNPPIQS